MGNCFTLESSPSLSSCSSCSSSHLNSLGSTSSCASCAAMGSSSATGDSSNRILPFPTFSDLGAHYDLGREIGRGQFGIIYLCTCRTSGTLFACKSVSKFCCTQHLHDILREVRIMQILSLLPSLEGALPNNVVHLHQVIEDDTHVHLIMELCNGGELFDRIVKRKCCPEPQTAAIIKSLMQSIQVCHSMGVMHRDIKPENILLLDDSDSSPIRLADFGLAIQFSPGEKISGMAGSSYYIAPEVLQGEYSEEIDVWSAGVVLYVMLSGVPPFWGETEEDIYKAIRRDVKARLTPAQVLEHPWILQHTKEPKQASQPQCKKSTSISNAPAIKTHELDAQNVLAISKPCFISPTPDDDLEQEKATSVLALQTPSSTSPLEGNEQKSALHAKTFSNVGSLTLQALHIDTNVKIGVDMLSMALVGKFDVKCLPMPESLAEASVKVGWSCALLSVGPTEQIFAVEVGKKSYLISYNNRRKLGWKILGQHNRGLSSSLHVITQPRLMVA